MFSWMLQNSPKTFKTFNIFWHFLISSTSSCISRRGSWIFLQFPKRLIWALHVFSKFPKVSRAFRKFMKHNYYIFLFCLLLDVFQSPHTFLNICWPFQHVPDLLKTLETYCIWYWFFNVSRKLPKFLGGLHILSRNLIKILARFGFSPSFGNLFITCHFN